MAPLTGLYLAHAARNAGFLRLTFRYRRVTLPLYIATSRRPAGTPSRAATPPKLRAAPFLPLSADKRKQLLVQSEFGYENGNEHGNDCTMTRISFDWGRTTADSFYPDGSQRGRVGPGPQLSCRS